MHRQIEALLNREPAAVVAVTVASWTQLLPLLTSIIGEGGFKPLYNRSVRLAAVQFPWLAHQLAEPTNTQRFEGLRACLEAADLAEARQASALQFNLFLGMLASLIGEQLTARILRSAWPEETPPSFEKDALK
jgi:hypothetical protein